MTNIKFKFQTKHIIIMLLCLLLCLFFPVFANRRMLNIAIMVLLYITLGESWNLLSGMAGLFNIVHALFFGLGVYSMTLTTSRFGANWIVGLLVGLIINSAMATLVGFIGSKLSGLYFTMALIGLHQTVYSIFVQWANFTGGFMGVSMPKKYLLSKTQQYYIILGLALFSMILFVLIRRSRMGTNFVALKENPDLAISLGSNIHVWRILAVIISAGLASMAGAFYAFFMMANNPDVFAGTISLKSIMVVIVGGMGHVFGPVLGSLMILLDEIVRGMMPTRFAPFSVIVYGGVLIIMALLKPEGIITIFKGVKGGKTPNILNAVLGTGSPQKKSK